MDQLVRPCIVPRRPFLEAASFLVASEDYTQEVKSRAGSFNLPPTATAGITIEKRRLESEVALVQLVDREVWLLARDVVTRRRQAGAGLPAAAHSVREVPSTDAAVRDFEAIAQAGARFNIGPIQRNLSVPTLALWFLTPKLKQQFQFDHVGAREGGGSQLRRDQIQGTGQGNASGRQQSRAGERAMLGRFRRGTL